MFIGKLVDEAGNNIVQETSISSLRRYETESKSIFMIAGTADLADDISIWRGSQYFLAIDGAQMVRVEIAFTGRNGKTGKREITFVGIGRKDDDGCRFPDLDLVKKMLAGLTLEDVGRGINRIPEQLAIEAAEKSGLPRLIVGSPEYNVFAACIKSAQLSSVR